MNKVIFESNKIKKDISIAILSDIHYYEGYNEKILNKLYKQIKNNKPDFICIPGDIVDQTRININNCKPLFKWLENIANISPTIIALGNHDIKEGKRHSWKEFRNIEYEKKLNSIKNVFLLNDEIIEFDNISFYGNNLSFKYYEKDDENYETFKQEIKNINPKFNKENYNIFLFHSPINIYKYLKENKKHPLNQCDLILSGHMHNGCIPNWICKLLNNTFKTSRSIISPLRTLFPKYSYGKIYNEQVNGFIYEGINKLSKCTKILHKLDFIYSKNIQIITIKKY